ncbi:MAG: phenylalanine--tRNA ligase subunit alpha [Ignavibacteria bacterium]|nr:phenylalanine--tRNA ligase subunit alpha [Ignavibacteria bacterium]
MLLQIDEIEKEISTSLPENPDDLENFRLKFLSRNGLLSQLFEELKTVSKEEKPIVGKKLNNLKKLAEEKYNSTKDKIEGSFSVRPNVDYTLPGRFIDIGHEHIISQTLEEFVRIFREIGFKVTEGPEAEDEFHNFDALNTPEHHPARDMQDTFYLDVKDKSGKKYLLRTHTSPVQIRTMLSEKPPLRIVCPGKVFRNEAVTPKNYFMFHQVEGLCVDRDVTMSDLQSVLTYFLKKFYGRDTKTRFIPSYFPFTEPSAQVDVSCFLCKGKGCKTCKNSGWLEIGGCGMVDPAVFEAVGYDPEIYTGYAFGMGIERIAMMKYGINDIRILYNNDVRFLNQF